MPDRAGHPPRRNPLGQMDRLDPVPESSRPESQFLYRAKPILVRRSFRTAPSLPKFIGASSDVLLASFVSDRACAMFGAASLMLILCMQVCLIGVLKALSGAFGSGQVIFFSVVLGAATMGVGAKVTVLCSYLL